MEPRDERQLERLIHRELRQLPELPAPETLVHRVMLQVYARVNAAWWKRSWLTWPIGLQFGSLVVLLASAGLVSYLTGAAWDGINATSVSARIAEWLATYAPVWETAKALANAALVLVRQLGQPLQFVALGSVLFAYFASVALGTVWFRFAFNRGTRP